MGQRQVCTFRHAQRAAYRTVISAAQACLQRVVDRSGNAL